MKGDQAGSRRGRIRGFAIVLALAAVMLTMIGISGAGAETAENLTAGCKISVSSTKQRIHRMTDGDYTSYWASAKSVEPWVDITSGTPIYGVYLCFERKPEKWEIRGKNGETLFTGETEFHHVYCALNGETEIRITAVGDGKTEMGFNEIFVFGEGEVPEWVQQWNPTPEKADILFFVAHPDDDLLFMGGAIASYGPGRADSTVAVAYLTYSNTTRRSEMLNGLWTLGIREYPIIGDFRDFYYNKSKKMSDIYAAQTGGKNGVLGWVTEMFRKYKPEVVVTQDEKGEYGHPQHRLVADASKVCFEAAAEAGSYPESAEKYGTWQVKKLYLHLYGPEEEQTQFDFTIPREEFGGLTANELAQKAFEEHKTQAGKGWKFSGKKVVFSVEEYGVKRYPANRYGLYATTVGADTGHTDFLENIYKAVAE